MAFRYVIKKRVFGFDETKSEKYVAASFSVGEISYDKLCDQVTKEGMAPRGVVKMVMDGLIDALSTYVSLGATVKLGDFGTIRPGLNCKSQTEAKNVTADSIYRQKLILTPGKRLKDMIKGSGVTRISTNGEDITAGNGNNGGGGNSGEEENQDFCKKACIRCIKSHWVQALLSNRHFNIPQHPQSLLYVLQHKKNMSIFLFNRLFK